MHYLSKEKQRLQANRGNPSLIMTDCLKYFISNQEPLLRTWQQYCLDVFFILRNFTAKQKVNSLFFSISHGLRFSTSCWETFLQVLVHFRETFSEFVSTNFLHSEQFLQLSSNSEISEQLLVLKLAFLPHFIMFQQAIYEFPVKKGAKSFPLGQIMGATTTTTTTFI